jgi:hypothetical protein
MTGKWNWTRPNRTLFSGAHGDWLNEYRRSWIKRSAVQLNDDLKGRDEEPGNGIAIGAFTLKQGNKPGKVWMTGPSGQTAELDEKVLEDVLKSFF